MRAAEMLRLAVTRRATRGGVLSGRWCAQLVCGCCGRARFATDTWLCRCARSLHTTGVCAARTQAVVNIFGTNRTGLGASIDNPSLLSRAEAQVHRSLPSSARSS